MKDLDIKNLTIDDLINKIKNQENDYQNIKFLHSVNTNKNPMIIRILRRKIAKLKTELNKRINDKNNSSQKKISSYKKSEKTKKGNGYQ